MTIYVTGDLHGNIRRLRTRSFREHGPRPGDYLIVLGDFGLVWHFPNSRWYGEECEDLSWLDDQPWTTLFIDGNHENFALLNAMPVEYWHGGKVHFVAPHIIHLMRGQVFDIEGQAFFAFGGATSIDRAYRVEGESWWPDEVPTADEAQEGLTSLWAKGMKVDYVLTHCAPSALLPALGRYAGMAFEPDAATEILGFFYKNTQFKAWLFGHYHFDVACGRYFCLLNNVARLDMLPIADAPGVVSAADAVSGTVTTTPATTATIAIPPLPSLEFSPLLVGNEAWPVDAWRERANALADTRSDVCGKDSPYRRGLTVCEICGITGLAKSQVEEGIAHALRGGTCGVGENGEHICYWSDLMRLFRELA